MMRIRYTTYKNSILASAISVIGSIILVVTILGLVRMVIELGFDADIFVVGMFNGAIGVGLQLLGVHISRAKQIKQFQKELKVQGQEVKIAASVEYAISIYNQLPGKEMLAYIGSLNPTAEKRIANSIAKK